MIVNDVTNDQNMYHVIECLLPPLSRCGGKLGVGGCQVGEHQHCYAHCSFHLLRLMHVVMKIVPFFNA